MSGKPTTYGGMVKNPALFEKTFNTQTLPDVPSDTRIIAICGITDYDNAADPSEDGWFLSDFYAFNYLLRHEGAAQIWFTTEKPDDLVAKYTEYLHGPQHKSRKVVLDEHRMRNDPPQDIRLAGRQDLVNTFLSTVRAECDIARALRQPVLVMLFGHGDPDSQGVELGILPSAPEPKFPLLEMDAFREAIGTNVNVTIFSTACYSGGWAVNPRLNTTTMAGAGPGKDQVHSMYITGMSESWDASKSLGRQCGSMYVTAVVNALTSAMSRETESGSSEQSGSWRSKEEQESTYASFTSTVHNILFTRVDKWAAVHDIRFSAQDDEWDMEWHQRTGFPLSHYASKWASLRDVMPDPLAASSVSRDPNPIVGEQGPSHLPRGATGSRSSGQGEKQSIRGLFGDLATLKSLVVAEGRMYLASFPGRDTLAANTSLHNGINMLTRGLPIDFERLSRIHNQIEFRMKAMHSADLFVGEFGLRGPGGKKCSQWDIDEWAGTQQAKDIGHERFERTVKLVGTCQLFPHPLPSQGKTFTKPGVFVATTLLASGMDDETLQVVLDELVAMKERAIQAQVETLSRYQTVKTAGRRYFATLGKRLRSLSPKKRSRGMSTESPPASHLPSSPPSSPGRGRRLSFFGRSGKKREE
ncbi:MAG: hypothetical protein Q9166_001993 [cf. Caloplaca sp. 2 TL-2023]